MRFLSLLYSNLVAGDKIVFRFVKCWNVFVSDSQHVFISPNHSGDELLRTPGTDRPLVDQEDGASCGIDFHFKSTLRPLEPFANIIWCFKQSI